jgi:hypothetical protein
MRGTQKLPDLQGRVTRLILHGEASATAYFFFSVLLERSKREDGETLASIFKRNEMVASDKVRGL